MKKIIFIMTFVMFFGIAVLAEATLFNRGGGLIYCDDLDITWLQDASYAMSSGYDADGKMTWDQAMTWAAQLEYAEYNDWRLPSTVDGLDVYGYEGDPDEDGLYSYTSGYNLANAEMGHLFYNELGNKGYRATDGTFVQPGWGLSNKGYFGDSLHGTNYWSGTEYASDPHLAWLFHFNVAYQYVDSKDIECYAWAVRPGDVDAAPIPVPGTMLLMVSGLLGVMGMSRFGQRHM